MESRLCPLRLEQRTALAANHHADRVSQLFDHQGPFLGQAAHSLVPSPFLPSPNLILFCLTQPICCGYSNNCTAHDLSRGMVMQDCPWKLGCSDFRPLDRPWARSGLLRFAHLGDPFLLLPSHRRSYKITFPASFRFFLLLQLDCCRANILFLNINIHSFDL